MAQMTWDYVLSIAEARGGILLTREHLMDLYVSHPAEVNTEAIKRGGPMLLDMVVMQSNGEDVDVRKGIDQLKLIFRDL